MQWKYHLYSVSHITLWDEPNALQLRLDDLGEKGWELVGTILMTDHGQTRGAKLIFKRLAK